MTLKTVSKSKILIANRLLKKVREVLENEDSVDFLDLLDEALMRYPNISLSELNEWKWSHGHCVASKM